jgi:hypothetical protein
MPDHRSVSRHLWRAFIEIGFIIFLFYTNLLMGEFSRSSHRTVVGALHDMLTPANFAIGLVAAVFGYGVVEFLRNRL